MSALALMFVDVAGSSRIYEQQGNRAGLQQVSQHLHHCRQIIEQHGGRVIKSLGDGIFASFVSSDFAFLAGMEIVHHHLETMSLRLRAGLHYGEVLQDNSGDLFGDAVNVCARIADLALPGQLLLSAEVAGVLKDDAPLRKYPSLLVKGRQQAVELFEALMSNADATMLLPRSSTDPALCQLRVRSADEQRLLKAGDTCSLGRAGDCDWVLSGARVSRHHARIESRFNQFFWTDLGSNGSVLILGKNRQLIHGTTIQLQGKGSIYLGGDQDTDSALIHYQLESGSHATSRDVHQ